VSDWTTQVADTVDGIVDIARERAVEPVQKLGRAIVYGLLATFFLVAAVTVLAAGVFRALVVYLPGEEVWPAHLITGGIFVSGGMLLWSKRR